MRQNMPCTGFWRPSEIIWCTYTNRQFQYMCRVASVIRVATIIHAQAVRSPAGQRPWAPGDVMGAEPPSKGVNGAAVMGVEPPSDRARAKPFGAQRPAPLPEGGAGGGVTWWAACCRGFRAARRENKKAPKTSSSRLSKSGSCLLSHLV